MNNSQSNTSSVNKLRKPNTVVFWKRIINLSMIILGILFVFSFVGYMQKRYSEMKNAKTSANALSSIIDTMDDNTEKVRLLTERYHFDNNSILEDIATLLGRGSYSGLYAETPEERCHAMEKLSNAVGGDGYIFVIDKDGNVVLTPSMDFIGINLKTIGSFSEDAYKVLTGPHRDGSFAVVSARPVGTDSDAYFYGKSLSDGYCLIYGVDSRILEEQYAALKNLGPILSSAVVGETGFIFAVDSSTREFLYFNDGNHDLSGKTSHEYGLSDEALSNGYEGEQTINGVSYHCISRTYSSELYGKYTVICAVCSTEEVFATNRVTVFVTSGTFFICTLLLFVYATLMHMDPDELADYDERILPASKAKYLHREPEKRKQIHNIQCLKLKHDVVFFKVSVAEKLAPIAAIGLILVFVVSWNAQTLVELSKGMTESAVALSQVERLFGSGETSSGILMDRYQNQYLSKIKLLSYILEEDPELVFGSAAAESGSDAVHTYLDEDYEPILDENGNPITSIAYSSALNELAAHNSIDTLFLFDDHGRTIATNTGYWYFTLSDDPDHQSYVFRDVVRGKVDDYTQEPGTDDNGDFMQYVGTSFSYFTLSGDGPDAGRYVSREAYNRYKTDGIYTFNDTGYTVLAHRGLLQGGINDATIDAIMESTQPEYLMQQVKVDENGFLVLFDNTSDHTCVWSPNESSIGKTAEELGISENAFSGSFKGFTRVNGIDYFQCFFFDNGYWAATTIPTDDLFTGRTPIALITLGVSAVFFLLLFTLCVFTLGSEEDSLAETVESRIRAHSDNGMVKVVMQNGKEKYARSASSRFINATIRWQDMLPFQKLARICRIILGVVVLFILIVIFFCDDLFGESSIISYIIHGDWEHGTNYFAYVAFTGMVITVYAVSTIISRLLHLLIYNMGTRVETIGRLLLSVVQYSSVLFSIFYGLSLLGVSTAGLVTSASIMSIVIGLGSQKLINDILCGIFIVFEGAFRVGDIVTVAGTFGHVVDIGLRTTKIETQAGDIMIYNNSSISAILNMTKKASALMINLTVTYDADLETTENILRNACQGMKERFPALLEDPIYQGITALNPANMTLTIVGRCAEPNRPELVREMTREFYLILRDNDIPSPYKQKS